MRLSHPVIPDIHVEVDDTDTDAWLAQGWLAPEEQLEPVADDAPDLDHLPEGDSE